MCKALTALCASTGTTQSATQTQPHLKRSRLKSGLKKKKSTENIVLGVTMRAMMMPNKAELDEEDGELDPRDGFVVCAGD